MFHLLTMHAIGTKNIIHHKAISDHLSSSNTFISLVNAQPMNIGCTVRLKGIQYEARIAAFYGRSSSSSLQTFLKLDQKLALLASRVTA